MVEITQRKWEELDLEALTTLTRSTFNFEGRGEYSQEQIKRHLSTLHERFPFEAVFVATQDETIIGWTGVERQTENIGEIGRWHPYVANIPERDTIAESLISEVMKYAKENGMNRLEIAFGEISDITMVAYNKRCSWLKSKNWSLVEDTFFMDKDASTEIPAASIPKGFSLHRLLESNDDELYSCHYAAFTSSMAREFYDLSEDEKRQQFDKIYDRTKPINTEASFVLKKGNQIASMLLVVSREDEEHIEVVAVHPEYRGIGLAKALLTVGIQKVREKKVTNVSIGVDIVNTPAVKLYEKFGFAVRSRLSFHSWSADNH